MNVKARIIEIITGKGFSAEDAETIYREYLRLKVLKIDGVNGSFTLAHADFFTKPVLKRALAQAK